MLFNARRSLFIKRLPCLHIIVNTFIARMHNAHCKCTLQSSLHLLRHRSTGAEREPQSYLSISLDDWHGISSDQSEGS